MADLALSELEAYDPGARQGGRERRFRCPLCESRERDLSANVETGAWSCYRCGEKGLLREFHTGPSRKADSGFFGSPKGSQRPKVEPKPASAPAAKSYDFAKVAASVQWSHLATRVYLEGRGLPPEVAHAGGYVHLWGRSCVAFGLTGPDGELAGLTARTIDAKGEPWKRTLKAGDVAGVFVTPGALDAPRVAIVEAPIDALSLLAAGTIPVTATIGTNLPAWVAERIAGREIYLAHDNDAAGENAANKIGLALRTLGARPYRFAPPPEGGKDWNDVLKSLGAQEMAVLVAAIRSADLGPCLPVSGAEAPSGVFRPTQSPENGQETPSKGTEAPGPVGLPVYSPDLGEVIYDPPRTVIIAGRPRERIARAYPGIEVHYANADHIEDSRQARTLTTTQDAADVFPDRNP